MTGEQQKFWDLGRYCTLIALMGGETVPLYSIHIHVGTRGPVLQIHT
jgi:hypothetical protein